jgi:hypothetical protein
VNVLPDLKSTFTVVFLPIKDFLITNLFEFNFDIVYLFKLLLFISWLHLYYRIGYVFSMY